MEVSGFLRAVAALSPRKEIPPKHNYLIGDWICICSENDNKEKNSLLLPKTEPVLFSP
jgi:hypothetical protein